MLNPYIRIFTVSTHSNNDLSAFKDYWMNKPGFFLRNADAMDAKNMCNCIP